MLKEAHNLMWDREFTEKRIKEQRAEINKINERWSNGTISLERYTELVETAIYIRNRLQNRLNKIYSLK